MVLNTDWAQVEVIDLINDGSGLAFGIIGGRSTGVVVKTIVPGGVADRDGRLQSGDHILQIGEVNLRGLGSEQVASVLRQCGVHVRMVVARPVESTSTDYQNLGSHAPIVPTKILGDPVELDKHLNDNGYGDIYLQNPSNSYSTPYIYTGQQTDVQLHTISGLVDVVRNPLPIGIVPSLPPQSLPPITTVNLLPLDMALRNSTTQPETEMYTIDLIKDELGLGITVAGYVCEKEEISGIFVKSISKGSAADLTGKIKINDRIIEVNGKSVIGQNNHQAVEILRNTGAKVAIRFERYLRGPKYEQLQQAILANEYRPTSPSSPSASSLPKIPLSLVHMSSLGIEPEGESRTSFDFDSAVLQDLDTPTNDINEIVIDTAGGRKSVQFSICSHESIHEKWREKLRSDVDIVIAEMNKESNSGLGISLEGTVDVEDGEEVRPHHYIRNILPNGPVGMNGILQSGDELLEVNGIQLLGLNHLEVVSILKQLPSLVILVCARYSLFPTRIIDTAQHKDAFQARNLLAGSINTWIQSNEKLVKAKSDTSIASSIVSETCCSIGSRSRSLELVAGLPMWSNEQTVVILTKGDHGLGFSILDYQDPLNTQETVIVIRSLIPGGIAQQDGRLIPGDRLLAVNDINVEHATLDRAVQVLKGAPKGPVKITVAKPLSMNDSISHHSQDTEDDQTCIDDFQECIEEYQECLEVVQICIEEDRPFNQSPCLSQVEDLGVHKNYNNKYLDESEPELSFKSMCDINSTKLENNIGNHVNTQILTKTDSIQSDKNASRTAEDSEKDGYETCLDESFSDEVAKFDDKTPTNSTNNLNEYEKHYKSEVYMDIQEPIAEEVFEYKHKLEIEMEQINQELQKIDRKKANLKKKEKKPKDDSQSFLERVLIHEPNIKEEIEEDTLEMRLVKRHPDLNLTKIDEIETEFTERKIEKNLAISEPCLNFDNEFTPLNHICLDTNPDDELKSYDNASHSDEFFLVQYPDDQLTEKCYSEPNVLERLSSPVKTYRYRIEEYYNDIEDCLESFKEAQRQKNFFKDEHQPEMTDEDIFSELFLAIKSRSAPDILDNSFITLTYDPGPDRARRKSSFLPGCINNNSDNVPPMTVHRIFEETTPTMKPIDIEDVLEKHWGPPRTVTINRDPNTSLGISIVGGKVDLYRESNSTETVLGIFIKTVVPNSPAGRSGELQTGDRILEVSGVSLKNVSHEKAVESIKYAKNPVTFIVQSLLPPKNSGETNQKIKATPISSPISATPPKGFEDPSPTLSPKLPTQKSVDFSQEVIVNNIEPEPTNERQKTVESSEESDDEEDVREMEGRTVSAKGQDIDRASAANVKRTKEEASADPDEEDDFGYTMIKMEQNLLTVNEARSDTIDITSNSLHCMSCGIEVDLRKSPSMKLIDTFLLNCTIEECEEGIKKITEAKNAKVKETELAKINIFFEAENGQASIVEEYLKLNIDVNLKDSNGDSLIHKASKGGNMETVQLLLNYGVSISSKNKNDELPLHIAAKYGYATIADALLNFENCVDVCDNTKNTALHVAVANGHKSVVTVLLNKNANTNIKNDNGETAFMCAKDENVVLEFINSSKFLLNKQQKEDLLFESIKQNWNQIFDRLIDDIGNANIKSTHKDDKQLCFDTPLLWAVQYDRPAILYKLIKMGADIFYRNKNNSTVLQGAATFGSTDCAKILITYGANVNEKGRGGRTPLLSAANNGHTETVKFLLDHNADILLTCDTSRNALHYSASEGHVETTEILLKNGAVLNELDMFGQTPLILAAWFGHFDAVSLLLNKGANVNIITKNNSTALIAASSDSENHTIKTLLKNHGAK